MLIPSASEHIRLIRAIRVQNKKIAVSQILIPSVSEIIP